MTTIGEAIEQLQNLAEEHGEETELRFMHQPSWPFEYTIRGITTSSEMEFEPKDSESEEVVYLVEGEQIGYGTSAAWDVV